MPSFAHNQLFIIAAAWLLDAAIGDPERLPHPVRAIGFCIARMEQAARRWFADLRVAGILIGLCVPVLAYTCTYCLIRLAGALHPAAGITVSVAGIYYCIATRCLAGEAVRTGRFLENGDLAAARRQVSRIVGRDTEHLDEKGIARATVESVSESTVDGIVSPLFFAFIGGAPLAMAFKAVSTLDSMIGYRNEKYRDLGSFSARLDDVMNCIPARLCLLLVPLGSVLTRTGGWHAAFRTGIRDGRNSPSPNSGYPEACFAGALGVQLGGACSYGGVISTKPLIGKGSREPQGVDIQKAVRLMWAVSALSLILFGGLYSLFLLLYGHVRLW